MGAIITKTGCYIPNLAVKNDKFLQNSFLDEDGKPFIKWKEDMQTITIILLIWQL